MAQFSIISLISCRSCIISNKQTNHHPPQIIVHTALVPKVLLILAGMMEINIFKLKLNPGGSVVWMLQDFNFWVWSTYNNTKNLKVRESVGKKKKNSEDIKDSSNQTVSTLAGSVNTNKTIRVMVKFTIFKNILKIWNSKIKKIKSEKIY